MIVMHVDQCAAHGLRLGSETELGFVGSQCIEDKGVLAAVRVPYMLAYGNLSCTVPVPIGVPILMCLGNSGATR